jgi:hypothetical protein
MHKRTPILYTSSKSISDIVWAFFCSIPGWGAGIRTPISRSRVGCPTIERHPNLVRVKYDTLTVAICQARLYLSTQCSTQSQQNNVAHPDDHHAQNQRQDISYLPGLSDDGLEAINWGEVEHRYDCAEEAQHSGKL